MNRDEARPASRARSSARKAKSKEHEPQSSSSFPKGRELFEPFDLLGAAGYPERDS